MLCKTDRRSKAFTLLEIMIVIVIIGLLAGVVTVNIRGRLIKAKQNVAKQEMSAIIQGMESFYMDYNRYPTNEEGIEILAEEGDKNPEPYLENVPIDPWSNEYQYNCPGTTKPFEVICYGADGREGGEGEDRDISSEDLQEEDTDN